MALLGRGRGRAGGDHLVELRLHQGRGGVLRLDERAVRGHEARHQLRHQGRLRLQVGQRGEERLGDGEHPLVELPLHVVERRVEHPLDRGGLALEAARLHVGRHPAQVAAGLLEVLGAHREEVLAQLRHIGLDDEHLRLEQLVRPRPRHLLRRRRARGSLHLGLERAVTEPPPPLARGLLRRRQLPAKVGRRGVGGEGLRDGRGQGGRGGVAALAHLLRHEPAARAERRAPLQARARRA
mmetsp:Transcript_25071/g.60026  ORF Transcript_25071/g.60026 Transcript_25071/m.60026 type:complete len:239 (-) Transcript_25071:102-818(-)